MINNFYPISFPSPPESKQNQDVVPDKSTPSYQVNIFAIDCLAPPQISKNSPFHPNPHLEQTHVHSMDEIENLFKCLKCIDAEFVKKELTNAILLIKQQDYITAQIIILEIALMHESLDVKLLTDKLLALIPAEAKKRKYSEISRSDGLDFEDRSCSDSESDSTSESDSDPNSSSYSVRRSDFHKTGRDYEFPPSKRMKVDKKYKLPKKNVGTFIRQKKIITPEIITKAEIMLDSGSKLTVVARDLHMNYHTLYRAIRQGKIVSNKHPHRQKKIITPETIAKVERMLASGSKLCDVARDLHINYHTLYRAIRNGKIISSKSHIQNKSM